MCLCILFSKSSKHNEVPSASNQLAVHHEDDKLTTTFDMPDKQFAATSFINDETAEDPPLLGYAVIDTNDVRKIYILQSILLHVILKAYKVL